MTRADPVDQVMVIVDAVRPLLRGKRPEIVGAALAELLATWVAGHFVPGSRGETIEIRASLLSQHLRAVAELVEAADPTKLESVH